MNSDTLTGILAFKHFLKLLLKRSYIKGQNTGKNEIKTNPLGTEDISFRREGGRQ